MHDLIRSSLETIAGRDRLRRLRATSLAADGRVLRDGRELLDFSSNDYLGLARHPLLAERARQFTAEHGTGAGASRLVTGTSAAHLALEEQIAAFKGTEAALVFASGWQANAALIPALLKAAPGAAVFTDRLVHNSVHHGCRAAGVRQIRFDHNDLDHLDALLARHGAGAPARLVITESVFSMDGDRADLVRLAGITARHEATLFVDEAHATGVLGPRGAGLSATLPGTIDIAMGTFSKALGGFGAYVACSRLMRDYLVNVCAGFIYSTAPPPAVLGAAQAALELVPGMEAERAHLAALSDRLRAGLDARGYDTLDSSTQIVPVVVGAEADALALAAHLEAQGILGIAIRPPTVPAGTSRVRLALRASHEAADIDRLLDAIGSWQ